MGKLERDAFLVRETSGALRRARRLIDLMKYYGNDLSAPSEDGRKYANFYFDHQLQSVKSEHDELRLCFHEFGKSKIYNCDILVACVGYDVFQLLNSNHDLPYVYFGGWASTGASGAITSTMANSKEVVSSVLQDFESMPVSQSSLHDLLSKHGLSYYAFKDWDILNSLEKEEGLLRCKNSEKIPDKVTATAIVNFYKQFNQSLI